MRFFKKAPQRTLSKNPRQVRVHEATTNSVFDCKNGAMAGAVARSGFYAWLTYIPTAEGWLYLAGIKDVFTYEIVGAVE